MTRITFRVALVSLGLVLGGCSFSSDALLPAMSGEGDGGQTAQEKAGDSDKQQPQKGQGGTEVAIPKSEGEKGGQPLFSARPPEMGDTNFQPPGVSRIQPTNTYVGKKVARIQQDLKDLQATIRKQNQKLQSIRQKTAQDAQRFHGTVAAINARLQVGTTPGNPILTRQWRKAQEQLGAIADDIDAMNNLSQQVADTAAMGGYILEAVEAAKTLSGAVKADHQHLAALKDDTNQTIVLIERLQTELQEDISRQQEYVANERDNLKTLSLAIKNGELYGPSFTNQIEARESGRARPRPRGRSTGGSTSRRRDTGPTAPGAGAAGGGLPQDEPLVVVRFKQPNVKYEQALFNAVNRALDRRPEARFEVVAVAPAGGGSDLKAGTARRYARKVLRSLEEMGLPPERVTLSATTSGGVEGNQVHVYVR